MPVSPHLTPEEKQKLEEMQRRSRQADEAAAGKPKPELAVPDGKWDAPPGLDDQGKPFQKPKP